MKRFFALAFAAVLLAGCSGTRHSMFPPTISVQNLKVGANGQWHARLRVLNNSYGSMVFTHLILTMKINNHEAAAIDKTLKLEIPELSADVTRVTLSPSQAAQEQLAAVAAKGSAGGLAYTLAGTADAIPENRKKPRRFKVTSHDWLSAVPGVPDTYR